MKITNYRCIKSLNLPHGWVENEVSNRVNIQAIRSFSPPDNSAVKMELFSRGLPISEAASISFRQILKLAPKMIFNRPVKNQPNAADAQLISDLREVLGNIGNNQLTNKQIGFRGAAFMLDNLEVLIWNKKPLLIARGCFQNPEDNSRVNEFYGFFIDANPNDIACDVDEIYFEAPTEELHKQYLPAFKQSLNSVQWLFI